MVEVPPRGASAAPPPCSAKQFVACESGAACATRRGALVEPKPCFDHAKDACDALACATGCDIHDDGSPKQVHCAASASSTGHMKRCGGYSGWGCPEDMRCEVPADHGFDDDALGTCVPDVGPKAATAPGE